MSFFFYLNLFYIINCSRNSKSRDSYTTYFNQKDIFTSINKKSVKDNILDRHLEENSNDEGNFKPIRLLIHKDYMDYQTIINKDEYYFQAIYESIDKAGDLLRKIINVKPLTDPIALNQDILGNTGYNYITLMQSLNNANSFNYDLIILIRLKEIGDYDEINYAIPEIILKEDQRPIVGSIIFKYDSIKASERENLSKNELVNLLAYIFLHEFTHILGFFGPILSSKGLLKTKIVERVNGSPKNKTIFIGPKVRKIASSYFNCPIGDGDGIEMDNYSQTEKLYNSHWEGRILLGDYMISKIYYPEQAISEVTLALLEDLGWYKIKYYTGGLMRFGKNKGCEFLKNDCIENGGEVVKSSFPNEFCSPGSFSTCSSGRLSRGYCYRKENDNIADAYVNRNWIYEIPIYITLNSYNQHGNELTEFCPISIETETDNNNYFKGSCSIGNSSFGDQIKFKNRNTYKYSAFNDAFGEIIGNSSFCALSTLLKKSDNDERYYDYIRPTCYQMFCSEKSLTIQINEEYIVCPNEGGIIYIDGEETNYKGYLICPDYYLICSGTIQCNNMFDCAEKESLYKPFNLTINNKEKIFSENTLNTGDKIDQNNIVKGWELDEVNGTCPIYCRQCISNKQCIICNESHTYYVGTKENDENPIYCYNSTPGEGYYDTNEYRNGKTYYFRCIENCIKCHKDSKDKCDQCDPIHFLDKTNFTCEEERIPGCKDYDNSSSFDDNERNNGGKAYDKCFNCDNDAGFYCVDNIKTSCVNLSNYTNETYYNMENKEYPCVQQCDKKYKDCLKCTSETCTKCKESNTFVNKNNNCVKNITHCKKHNENNDLSECLQCDENYYCLGSDTERCVRINNINLYYSYSYTSNNIQCYEMCNITFPYCESCNKDKCTKCFDGYYLNNNNKCLANIDNCITPNLEINDRQCLECANDYYCIRNNTLSCNEINDNIDYYYPYNYTERNKKIKCYERCNNTFLNCAKCTQNGCTECKKGFFVYNGRCVENITGCIDHFYNGIKKECNECNKKESYYCLNKTRTECYHVDIKNYTPYYYMSTENNFSCYITCDHILQDCLTCDNTQCLECTASYIINDAHTQCLPRPFDIPENDNCTLKIIETDKTIFEIDPWDIIDAYWKNIPYISTVEHYIGNNFTITAFVNSECTQDLFDEGYFKINSSELQNIMIKESRIDGMKIIFTVFINYNHKNHLRYYNISLWYLDPYKLCNSCLDVDYFITNKFYDTLNDTFGKAILNLVYSENIDILDKDSEIYNDICENVTLHKIDIPLKKRLHYLYMHKHRDIMLCNAENCTVEEYFYENSTVICKCHMGNKYEDVIYSEKFEYQPYDDKEDELKQSNEFVESLSTIKCTVNGFKLKNFKSNIGIFICIGFLAIQIGLFIFYFVRSKPVVNVNKSINMSSPPKRSQLKFITDWDRSFGGDKIGDEDEIFVQPRDDADDQLLEEERSYADNMIDLSGLSIETNFGGAIKNISTGNKLDEKADQKRVLILLSNRGKNKSKNLAEDMKSDSDIIPQIQDENNPDNNISYGKIYWHVLSLKQHIINFFSFIDCCKITESYIPLSIRLIRSLFMIILSLVINILFLNQTYYDNKFDYFNKEYIIINSETDDINIPSGKRITYAVKNTFGKAVISFIILLAVQFIFGIVFFSVRKSIIKAKMKKSHKVIQEIIAKSKKKNIAFYIIVMVCMILFFFTISGFIGIYGGGVVDYLTAGIISLILLEIFPFIWSLIIALFTYLGMKNNNKCCYKFSGFFMF